MRAYLLLPALALLSGCNWVMNVSGLAAEANKAIGAACRQTGRSLEACYTRNPDADKAQIYAGWREMHEYMAKNKLETMDPPPEPAPDLSAPLAAVDSSSAKAAEHAAQKKNEPALASLAPLAKPHSLTSAEADELARNDPQVEAVLSAIRKNGRDDIKPKDSGPSPAEQRLLSLINEQSAPPAAVGQEDSFGKPAAMVKK
ncbi:hypothetical protein [Vogesella alkaliphila]|uniref:Lipoprotein n=1 Tax=Vogesella alkaliphila TaxID=1193621 RepID=A0ABQ2YQR6_9NEIS|nr:hypothetical protein [Vogesella alkaliphila]GGX90686.1 hypothetical protein GCM10011290_18010 [Vogesella alkaliphila]